MAASHLTGGHWVDAGDMATVKAAGWGFVVESIDPSAGQSALFARLDAAKAVGLQVIINFFPYPFTWNGTTWTITAAGQARLADLASYNTANPGVIFAYMGMNEPYQLTLGSAITATALKAFPAAVKTYFPAAKIYHDMDQPDAYAGTYPDQTGIADYVGMWDYPFLEDGSYTREASRSRILQQHKFIREKMGAQPVVLLQSLADPTFGPHFRFPSGAEMQDWVDAIADHVSVGTPLSWYVWNQASYTDYLKNHQDRLVDTLSTKVPMSFPTTPVLDNFDRANNANLGANWVGNPIGLGWPDYAIAGNLASAAASSWCSSAWNSVIGPDIEAYVTLTTVGAPIYGELIYGASAKSSTFNGYSLRYDATHIYLGRYDAGVWTQLAVVSITLANGNKWGVSRIGNTHTVYVDTGSGFGSVLTTTDGTYSAAGYIMLVTDNGAGVTLNDFGGGAPVVAPTNSAAPSVSGSQPVGSLLTCANGTWTGAPSFTYQWTRDGVNIAGATAQTYTTVSADSPHNIACNVTGTNGGGSLTVGSSNSIACGSAGGPSLLLQWFRRKRRWWS